MKVKCIENKHNNGNFTLGNTYEIRAGGKLITCDFIQLPLPDTFRIKVEETFEFAMCKFEIIT